MHFVLASSLQSYVICSLSSILLKLETEIREPIAILVVMYISPSVYLFIYLFIYQFIYLFIYLVIYLFIYLFFVAVFNNSDIVLQ